MRTTITRLAPITAIAALALTGCGSTDQEATDAPAPTTDQSETDDGADDQDEAPAPSNPDEEEAWPIVDAGHLDGPFTLEGATGGTLDGSVYTLGAPEALPEDIGALLAAINIPQDQIDSTYLIPVNIDNSGGTETQEVYSASAVTEDGESIELNSLSGSLIDTADELGPDEAGYDAYEALWDRGREESVEVLPTAEETAYLVLEDVDDPDALTFTYFEIQPPMMGDPIPMGPVA